VCEVVEFKVEIRIPSAYDDSGCLARLKTRMRCPAEGLGLVGIVSISLLRSHSIVHYLTGRKGS
jgi:hypothetical protein